MKAIIFAAGLGTRLRPLTDRLPKALVTVGGKTLLEHIVLKLKAAGFKDIVINVHHYPDMILHFLESKRFFGVRITLSDERDKLLDTGGGILRAMPLLDDGEPFLAHNVDILSDLDLNALYTFHCRHAPLATLAVSHRNTSRQLLFDPSRRLRGWMNEQTGETKPAGLQAGSQLHKWAFSGVHVLSPRVFGLMQDCGDTFSITDFYLRQAATHPIMAYLPDRLRLLDVGKPDTLQMAERFLLHADSDT